MNLADLFLAVRPDLANFGPELNQQLAKTAKRSGDKAGRTLGAGVESGAAKIARGKFMGSATMKRGALASGTALGATLAKKVASQMAGRITQRAGQLLGDTLAKRAVDRLRRAPWAGALKNVVTEAGKVGQRAGAKILSSAQKRMSGGSLKLPKTAGGGLGGGGAGGLLGGLGKGGVGGLAAAAVGGGVVGAIAIAKRFATAASDMNETISKGRTIFGASSKSIESWARGAAKNLGMSRQEALEGASSFGNLFDQLGFAEKASVKMSTGFAKMATDAASFNNADPSQVMDAFLSATRGEYDALQRYIPTIKAATVEAEAMRMTHKKSADDLTEADKAAALYRLSVKGLGKAHGDFARTSGGFANQQRILSANWADLRVKIGQYFLPTFTKAAVYMNQQGFPALTRIVRVLGATGQAAGRMGRAVLSVFTGSFGPAIDGMTTNLTEIATWLETHQEAMVRFFIRLGFGAIDAGRGITGMVTSGIRGFGDLAGSMSETVTSIGNGIASLLEGAAALPFIGDDTRTAFTSAAVSIRLGTASASKGLLTTRTRAHEAADAIANRANPVFDAMEEKLAAVGRTEIWTAKQKDAAARAVNAIRAIGTTGDATRFKLHDYNVESGKGTAEQLRFAERVKAARTRLIEQRIVAQKAGETQAELTKRWDKGREALYREFIQMGFSKSEAQKLTDKYGKIPTKKETRIAQPGMRGKGGALDSTSDLDRRINDLNNKGVNIKFTSNAAEIARAYNIRISNRGSTAAQGGTPRNVRDGGPVEKLADGGRIHGWGGSRADNVAGVDRETGRQTHWLSPEEFVVNAASYRKHKDTVEAINDDRFPALASGGPIKITTRTGRPPGMPDFNTVGNRLGSALGGAIARSLGSKIDAIRAASLAATGSSVGWSGGSFRGLSSSQMGVAATVAGVGKAMGRKAQLIGLIAGMVESNLTNVNYGDRDSLGVFQQRAPWGPASVRRNVRLSAGMFYHGGRGGQPGLDDIGGWQGMSPGRAAQRVQVSAFPGRYATRVPLASAVLAALSRQGGARALAGVSGLPGWMGGTRPVPGGVRARHGGYPWANWAGDFRAGRGTPIRAWKEGTVAAVNQWAHSYGRHVRVNHPGGSQTLSAHMQRTAVRRGQRVGRGAIIGYVDSTGNSTGDHLHWEVKGLRDGGLVGRGPGLASGGTALRSGWARVGERGPETIHMNKGDTVVPNGATHVHIYLDGQEFFDQLLDENEAYHASLARARR